MSTKTEQAIVEVIIKGQQSNATLKELEASGRALRAQLSRLPIDSQEFVKKSAELQKVNARLQAIRNDIKGTSEEFKKMSASGSGVGNAIKGLLAGFTVVTGVQKAIGLFKDWINVNREFEKSLANLSAITGATGNDLIFYGEKAKEMGLRVKGGAVGVVEAFKLIASAKPELLKDKEALTQVTEAAILLAHASGLEVPDAATRLTDALAQYGAPAAEAAKYVDALAAAAKYGAAEVPQVTDAVLQFGQTAKASNINIYESSAAVELLAEKGKKGAEAGVALRNIFTKLAAADVLPEGATEQLKAAGVNIEILKNKSIPLADRLQELSKIAGNAAALVKVFRLENKEAADVLISNIPRLRELAMQIRETGVASQQAAVNMDTYDQKVIELGNSWDNLLLSIKGTSAAKSFVQGLAIMTERMAAAISGKSGELKRYYDILGAGFTDEQAKRIMKYGFVLDSVKSKALDQTLITLIWMKRIDAVAASSDNAAGKMAMLRNKSDELYTSYRNGAMSAKDYVVVAKMLTEAMQQQSKAMVAPPPLGGAGKKGLVKALQDDIAELEQKRIDTTEKSEIESMGRQIKIKQDLLDALLGKESDAMRKLKDKHKQLLDDLYKMSGENAVAHLSENGRKIAEATQTFTDVMKGIEEDALMNSNDKLAAKAIALLNYKDKVEEIEKKQNDEDLKQQKEHLKAYEEMTHNARENEISAVIEKFDKEIEYYQSNAEKVVALENAKQLAIQEIKGKYAEKKEEKKNTPEVFGFLPSHDDMSRGQKQLSGKLADALKVYQAFYQQLSQLQSAWAQLQEMDNQEQTDQIEMQAQRKIDAEKHRLDGDQINQQQYNKRVEQINHEKEMRERKLKIDAAQKQKQLAIFTTILNTAEAITQVLATWIAVPPVAAALTAIATAAGAAQLAVISSQPIPKFAKGGFVGSETMMSSASGAPFIAGEKGAEWVAPNWMLQHPITANTIGMLEAIREHRSFAAGGSTAVRSDAPGGSSRQSGSSSSGDFGSLVKAINRLNSHLDRGIDASLNYDDFTKSMKSIDSARKASSV